MKLVSHVNGDNDLIESWLKYYIRLGVEHFHLVVHGPASENQKILAIKDQYPVTIDDAYQGPFDSDQKKCRLDAVLSRLRKQWVVLVDSDEFVEFPYEGIHETVRWLEHEGANVMAAPMLQRLTRDGSLESPPTIDDPFGTFPLCSASLYRQMGMTGDVFKFPLFFCTDGTRMREEGNHHPPLGPEPRGSRIRGVTHHFKFRRTVSQRLEKMIRSEHPWRHESVQLREYLDCHAQRLPLDDAFEYSREELFRRRLLQQQRKAVRIPHREADQDIESPSAPPEMQCQLTSATPAVSRGAANRKLIFVLPNTREFGGLERHLFTLLRRLDKDVQPAVIVSLDFDTISKFMDGELREAAVVKCVAEPQSVWEWYRMIREVHPDVLVFCYNWFRAFSWKAPLACLLAGVHRRVSIQHLLPLPPPPAVEGKSLTNRLRRLVGGRARYMLKTRLTGHLCHRTICVSNAVRDSLVNDYHFPARKTITIHNGVSTVEFAPCKHSRTAVRTRFDIDVDDFLVVCAARLTEAKGIDILIHAVSRVLRQGVSCKCIILGDGPLKVSLEAEVNALGLFGQVLFEGFQKDVKPYLQAASAFALTSHIEGLPLSILEAMACGLPCIVTDVGGNAEAVRDRVTGLLIKPGSLDEAEEAILYLATHPRECMEMASKSREAACELFDIESKMRELKAELLA